MLDNDYALVERAILSLDQRFRDRPGLADVAASLDLSDADFGRLLYRWAGVSPERFQHYVSPQFTKQLLSASHSRQSAGGPEDDSVVLEVAHPGRHGATGIGLTLTYGYADTPFGRGLIATCERGIRGLYFARQEPEQALEDLRREWPAATLVHDDASAEAVRHRIFAPADPSAPLRLLVKGTDFQVEVWRALLRIPAGSVACYEDVAIAIGKPRATRAVGTAIGSNPICYLIPCHRVIRKTGDVGNYGGSVPRKRAMLAWEASRANSDENRRIPK